MLELYNTSANNIHYTLHNLFRGLKSIRRKYKLTINEIIFLNGMYLYCKHESACISQNACLKFIGSLLGKGMIEKAEVIKGYDRYKITPLGLSAIYDINDSFDKCLYEWFTRYSIDL